MSDTLSFASRLCKFVILLVILLIGGASLFLCGGWAALPTPCPPSRPVAHADARAGAGVRYVPGPRPNEALGVSEAALYSRRFTLPVLVGGGSSQASA